MEQGWLQRIITFNNIAQDLEGFETLLKAAVEQMNEMELTKLVKKSSLVKRYRTQ